MAVFNLNSVSSQNYYTVVGEKNSLPLGMIDLQVFNDGSQLSNYVSSLSDLTSGLISFAGSESNSIFEDLSGLSNYYYRTQENSDYYQRAGHTQIIEVSQLTYADGTHLDKVSVKYDADNGIDYIIDLFGSLAFDNYDYNSSRASYTLAVQSYQKEYLEGDLANQEIIGVYSDPVIINLFQDDSTKLVWNYSEGDVVAASLVDGWLGIDDPGQNFNQLDALGILDFNDPNQTQGLIISFASDSPYIYHNNSVSGEVSSLTSFTASSNEQGIDIAQGFLQPNYILGAPNTTQIEAAGGGSPQVSSIEVTHGDGPFSFDFRTFDINVNSDSATIYSGALNNIDSSYLSSETPLHDFFSEDDTLNLTNDTHGQTIYAGAGDDVINAGSGNDIIFGNGGIDTVYGNAGDDQIIVNDGFYTIEDAFYVNSNINLTINDYSYRTDNGYGVEADTVDGGDGNDTLVLHDRFNGSYDYNDNAILVDPFLLPGWIDISFRSSWYDFESSHELIDDNGTYAAYSDDGYNIDIVDHAYLIDNPYLRNENYKLTNVEFIEVNGERFDIRPLYLSSNNNDTLYALNSDTYTDFFHSYFLDPFYYIWFVEFNGKQYYYINGQDGNDTIYGTDAKDAVATDLASEQVYFYTGEILDGGDGIDTLIGGAGNDHYYVNVAEDVVIESTLDDGFDTVIFAPNTASNSYTLSNNAAVERLAVNHIVYDNVTGSVANNFLVNLPLDSDEVNITGGNYTYELIGHNGDNIIRAGDQAGLIAQPNQDTHRVILLGLGGNDTIYGGAGKDQFFSGAGNDLMYGNDGDDRFYFGLNVLDGRLPYSNLGYYYDISGFDSTFSSPLFDEYYFENPQELTGGQDLAFGGDGIDQVEIILPLSDQPSFQRTSNSAIQISTAIDSLTVDSFTEILHNYTFAEDGSAPIESTTKILPSIWSTIEESYEAEPARNDGPRIEIYQDGSTPATPIYSGTGKKRKKIGEIPGEPIYKERTVFDAYVPPVIEQRYYPDEKAIFEKINALSSETQDFLYVSSSDFNDFIVASALDDGATFSNDLGLTSYNINGGLGNDMIFASTQSEWIRGGAGQDFLYGINAAINIDSSPDIVSIDSLSTELTFNANSDVADGDDTITITHHGLTTGQAVIYHDDGHVGAVSGGLTGQDGQTFYVLVVDDNRIKLSISYEDAMSNAAIDISPSGQSVTQTLTAEIETIVQTEQSLYGDAGNDTLTVDLSFNYFDIEHPNSETITFNPNAVIHGSIAENGWYSLNLNAIEDGYFISYFPYVPDGTKFIYYQGYAGQIGGLENEHVYTYVKNPSDYSQAQFFDEYDSAVYISNDDLNIPDALTSGDYFFKDFYTYTFEINAHGFKTGDTVVYGVEGSSSINGLTDGDVYYVIRLDDNNFQLAASSSDAFDTTPINFINVVDPNTPESLNVSDYDHTFTFTPTVPYHFNLDGGLGDDTYRIKASFNEAYLSTFDIHDESGSNTLIYVPNDTIGDASRINGLHPGELFFQWDLDKLNAINNEGDLLSSIETGTISRFVYSNDSELFTPLYSYNLINPSAGDYLDGTPQGTSGNDLFFSINGVKNKFYGGAGNDLIILNEVDGGIASGGLGNNKISIATAAIFNQSFYDHPNQTLSYEWTSAGMSSEIDLSTGFAYVENQSGNIIATDQIDNTEYFTNVTGGNANDTIIGNQYQNTLIGGGGNDTIYAGNNSHLWHYFTTQSVDQETNTIYLRNHGFQNGEYVYTDSYIGPDGTYYVILIDQDHFKLSGDYNESTYDFSGNFFSAWNSVSITSWNQEGGDLLQGGAGDDTLIDDSNLPENWYQDPDVIESPILEGGAGNDTYIIQQKNSSYNYYYDFRPTLVDEHASNGSDSGGIDTVRLERENVDHSIWSSEEVNFNVAFQDDPNTPAIEIGASFYGSFYDPSGDYIEGSGLNPWINIFDFISDTNGDSIYDDYKSLQIYDHGLETGDRVRIEYNSYSQPISLGYYNFFNGYDTTSANIISTSDQIIDNLYKNTAYYVIKIDEDKFALAESLTAALNAEFNSDEDGHPDLSYAIDVDKDGSLSLTAGTFKIIKESLSTIDFDANTTLQDSQTVFVDFHNQLDYIPSLITESNDYGVSDFNIYARDQFYNIENVSGQHYGLDYLNSFDLTPPYVDVTLINPRYLDGSQLEYTNDRFWGWPDKINKADVWSKTSNKFQDFNEVSYSQSGTTVTIFGQQNYDLGDHVMLNFSNANITDGLYKITAITSDGFKVNVSSSGSGSGTVAFSDHVFDGYSFTWLDDSYVAISKSNFTDLSADDFSSDNPIDYHLDSDGHIVVDYSNTFVQAVVDKNALEYIDFATTDNQSLSYKYKVNFDAGADNLNPEVIISSQEADSYLFGNAGTDIIFDTNGNDILLGGKGNDYIQSLNGFDLVNGGEGDDVIHFQSEGQIIIGGKGADEFRVSGTYIDSSGVPSRELATIADNFHINFTQNNIALLKDFNLGQGDSIRLSKDFLDNINIGYQGANIHELDVGFTFSDNNEIIYYLTETTDVDYPNVYGLFALNEQSLNTLQIQTLQDNLNYQLTEYALSSFATADISNNWWD